MQRDQRAYILQNISTHSMDCTPAHSSAKSLGEKLWARAGVGLHNHQLLCMAMAIDRNTMKHCLIKGKHRTSPNYVVVWYPCVACAERRLRCSHQCPNLSIWVWLQLMGGTRPTVSPVEASTEPNDTRPCQAMFERQSTLQDQGAQGNSDQSRGPWTKNTSHRHHLDRWNMWQYPSSVAIGTQGTCHHLLHSSAQGPVQLLMELVSAFSCRCHLAATTEDSLILIYLDYGHPDPQVNYMVNSNLLLAERHI